MFYDGDCAFTAIREKLARYPDDVRKKKLAGYLLLMAQSGGYNYPRILSHGEPGAAALSLHEYVIAAMHAAFLLNRRYCPFYKWSFRALRELPLLPALADDLTFLLTGGDAEKKQAVIAETDAVILAETQKQGFSAETGDDPEKHAYAVNASIADADLRSRHILYAVT